MPPRQLLVRASAAQGSLVFGLGFLSSAPRPSRLGLVVVVRLLEVGNKVPDRDGHARAEAEDELDLVPGPETWRWR